VRLLVPGWGANHSVKWLRQIKVIDRPYMTWDQSVHHTVPRDDLGGKSRWYNFVWPPKSVILRPSGGQQLPGRGYYEITGLAWSGGGAIRRVEVSIDRGKSWKDDSRSCMVGAQTKMSRVAVGARDIACTNFDRASACLSLASQAIPYRWPSL
jgi:DMSO/TMAO reductase YedYZ molybdopterin-dependent catalytic subunit